jgi:hypothetical protein
MASEFWSEEKGFPNLRILNSKLFTLYNCTNEESNFYLKSCFHNPQQYGDFTVSGEGKLCVREMLILFWYFPPIIDGALPLRIFYPILTFLFD